MKRRFVVIAAVVWMMVIVAVASSGVTLALVGQEDGQAAYLVSEQEFEMIQRYSRLENILETLLDDYYQPLDEDALITGAIRGMMDSIGDPYTFYYTAEEMQKSNEESNGVYHGVGMVVQLTEDGYIEITRIYTGAPAEQAGLRTGDRIIAVDGQPVSGENAKTLSEAVSMIQGEDGTQVHLTLLRNGETMEADVTRAEVSISYVEYSLIGNDVGYVSISQFTGNDVDGFSEALEAFKSAGVSGIVVDLRGNPGGLLADVVKISDMVLPEGLVTYVEDRDGNRQE